MQVQASNHLVQSTKGDCKRQGKRHFKVSGMLQGDECK
jgi:hypothetical protein